MSEQILKIIKENALSKVKTQIDVIQELKRRSGILLGFTIAFLGFILSNKTVTEALKQNWVNLIPIYLILFSLFLFILSLVVKTYSFSPDPLKLYNAFKDKEDIEEIDEKIIKRLNEDWKENTREIKGLRKLINWGIFIDAVSVVWIINALIYLL